jgi:hypothetical protein
VLIDDVCVSGWRAGKASSEALATKISDKLAGGTAFDLIVLQLFDNTSYYARTCEGGLIPCRRELNSSTYHIDSNLVLQLLEALERSFDDANRFSRPVADTRSSSSLPCQDTSWQAVARTRNTLLTGGTATSNLSSSLGWRE